MTYQPLPLPPLDDPSTLDPRPVSDAAVTMTLPQVATPEPALPGMVGGYQIEKRIGGGAMGEVFLAHKTGTGQEAALKVITDKLQVDELYLKRFERECDLLSRLDHPNIAKALDHGVDQGRPFLAMEFVRGDNLEDILKARGKLMQSEVLHLAIQVARGLEHAFSVAGLIHRDIKPANIILTRTRGDDDAGNDQAKIVDFGLAKDAATKDLHLTMSGVILGTPHYMSPEQIRCEDELTFATDLYALGATLFHLLTGRVPFPRPSPAAVLSAHLTEAVPNPSDLQPGLNPLVRQIVRRCLAKDPCDRYADWRSFIIDCGKALKGLGVRLDGTVRIVRRRVGSAPIQEARAQAPGDCAAHAPAPAPAPAPATSQARPAGGASSGFRPSSQERPGTGPLAIITGRLVRSPRPVTGCEALRSETAKKLRHLSTTQRLRRRQEVERDLLPAGVAELEPFALLPRSAQVRVALPWAMLGLGLVALSVVAVLGV